MNETLLSSEEQAGKIEKWKRLFETYRKSDENPDFYIDYVTRRRKELNLPPIY